MGLIFALMLFLLLLLFCSSALASDDQLASDLASDTEKQPTRHESVIVTGSYEPIPLEDRDRSVSTFDVSELELMTNTLADLLRLDPSLDLRSRAPDGVQSDLSIRGGTFGQTLILLDGVRINDAQSGHHNMDIPVPLSAVSRLEILRGSGSTLYGSDAVGGVLNIITKTPEFSEFRLRSSVGNFGVNQQRGTLALVRGRVAEQISFSRDFSSGFSPNRDYRNLSISSTTDLSSRLGETDLTLAHNDRPFGADQFYGNFNSWERTKTWYAAVRQQFGPRTVASFAFRRHTDLFVLFRDRPEVFTNRHAARSFQASLRRQEPLRQNIKLHYGVEGYRDSIDSNNLGQHARSRGAGYLALDVRAVRRFSFTLGVREEVYTSLASQFSPTFSTGVWLSPHFKLRGSVGRAFRLPSYTELYYHDPCNQGSPDLRPEKAWSYEGGLDWNAGRKLRGDVVVFQRRERDGIDWVRRSASKDDPNNPCVIWRATNIQRLRFTGLEASVSTAVARSHWLDFRYSALHGAQADLLGFPLALSRPPGASEEMLLESLYVFNYPSQAAVVSWRALLPHGLVARTRVGATKRFARDPYALWDLYLARAGGRFRPFLQFSNLTNTAYQEIAGIPMPGRSVIVGVELVVFSRAK